MEVYIEFVILDNFAMDFLILYLTQRLLRRKGSALRLALGSGVGCLFALLLPLMPSGILAAVCRWAAGVAVYAIGCARGGWRRFSIGLAVFFAVTFALGGAVTGLASLLGAEFFGEYTYFARYPVVFLLASGIFILLLFGRLIGWLEQKKQSAGCLYRVRVTRGERSVETAAFLDTGNRVYKGDDSVQIVTLAMAERILGEDFGRILLGKKEGEVEICSASGEKRKLVSFYADRLDILDSGQSISRVCFAVVAHALCDAEEYEILLSPALLALPDKGGKK